VKAVTSDHRVGVGRIVVATGYFNDLFRCAHCGAAGRIIATHAGEEFQEVFFKACCAIMVSEPAAWATLNPPGRLFGKLVALQRLSG